MSLLRQIRSGRRFCVPEVKLVGQIQLVLLLKKDDLVDLGPSAGVISLANGLLRSQKVGVRLDLRRKLSKGRDGPL